MQADNNSFDLINQRNIIDKYTFLPLFWQAMSLDKKKIAVPIVQRFAGDNAWSPECCRKLMDKVGVKLADLTALQPCIFLLIKNSTHLDRD